MTQDELREAVLSALLDYETLKKKRRLKAVKKALQGTMVATVIGSTGLMAASQGRGNQVREMASIMVSTANAVPGMMELPQETDQIKIVPGVAHFALNGHTLTSEDEGQLMSLINQVPKDAELTVIGCTDSVGGQRYNKKLGIKRAEAAASFLAQHGMKIKKIANLISQNKHAGWLARRVDIVVDSSMSHATADTLPPPSAQQPLQQIRPAPPMPLPALDNKNAGIGASQGIEKPTSSDSVKSTDTVLNTGTVTTVPKSGQYGEQRHLQLITGVTHYASNRHTLASAHKDRLMELIKQLPGDAEVTVIGRTDPNGIQAYNKNLGMQRAKAVANFLASHGVKIKAVGTKVSNSRHSDWMARRVDVVVDTAQAPITINLPPPVSQEDTVRTKTQTVSKDRPLSSIDGKRAAAIEKDVTGLMQRAKSVYNEN